MSMNAADTRARAETPDSAQVVRLAHAANVITDVANLVRRKEAGTISPEDDEALQDFLLLFREQLPPRLAQRYERQNPVAPGSVAPGTELSALDAYDNLRHLLRAINVFNGQGVLTEEARESCRKRIAFLGERIGVNVQKLIEVL